MRNAIRKAVRAKRFAFAAIEAMEARLLLSSTPPAIVSGNVLTVTGTAAADTITVNYSLNDPGMSSNSGETYVVFVNGATQTLTATTVSSVVINSGDGNDSINVSGFNQGETTSIVLHINAGGGNDTLTTSLHDDGASGNYPTTTTVVAGNGNDSLTLDGGSETSITVGSGNDSIEVDAEEPDNLATIVAGNGNDFFESGLVGAASSVYTTITAGTGDDRFYNEDPDDELTATAAGGPTFIVSDYSTSVTGRAYIDNNLDGVYDTGDTLLANTQVYLDANHDGVYDAGDTAATTSARGYYELSEIDNVQADGTGDIGSTVTPALLVTPPAGYAAVPRSPAFTIDTGYSAIDLAVEPVQLTGTAIGTAGSYDNDGSTAAAAFDGNLSTFFDGPTANGDYAGLNLGSSKVVTSVSFAPRAGFAGRMVGGIFQGSNSAGFTSPTTLYTITTAPAQGVLTTVDVSGAAAFQYVRYLAPAGSYGNIAEAQFFGVNPAAGQIFVHLIDDPEGSGVPYQNQAGLGGFGTFIDFNRDGVFDGTDVRMITDTAGDADFSGLAAGTYTLTQNVSAGYAVTTSPQFPMTVTVTTGGVSSVQAAETEALTGTLVATAGSYDNGGDTAANALDGNFNTFFDGPTANGNYVGIQPGGVDLATQVTQIRFAPRTGYASRMLGGVFQGSNSSSFANATTLYTISTAPAQGVLTTVQIGSGGGFLYYRYLSPAGSYGNVAEVEFFGRFLNAVPASLTGTAIGTAGSYDNSDNTIANVFDGNLVSYFDAPVATGAWVGLDLGTAQVVTEVQFAPRPSFESRMIGGEIQGSNTADFSSGVATLATITTLPSPGALNTLQLANITPYRYYRYFGPVGSYCDIAELKFFTGVQ